MILVFRRTGQRRYAVLAQRPGLPDLEMNPAPEPLIAPPGPDGWSLLWSSESIAYGGNGTPPLNQESEWRLPGETAVLLKGSTAHASA